MALESQAPLGETLFIKEGDFSVPSTSMTVVDDQKPAKKQTRQWAAWTRQEEENFFNALRQVGKNFEKITCRVQSKNKNQVRHYYYRLVRRMNKLLGPGFCLDAKNSKDTNAAMLRWWSLLEKYSCTASKLHLKPRRFKIFVEALENQLLKDRNKNRRRRPCQGEGYLSASSTASVPRKALENDSHPVKLLVVDTQHAQKLGVIKESSLKRNMSTKITFTKGELPTTRTVRQYRRPGVASYKRWEKAAIAGVSLVADAAEQLERATNDGNCSFDQGPFAILSNEMCTSGGLKDIDSVSKAACHLLSAGLGGMCSHQSREAVTNAHMKLKLQLFPIDEVTRQVLEKEACNPHLELTLSPRKRISSVLEHLNRKWSNLSIASRELVLLPYITQQEGISSHLRWTVKDIVSSAADVYATVGSPPIFRLRYGWFANAEPVIGAAPMPSPTAHFDITMHSEDIQEGLNMGASNGEMKNIDPSIYVPHVSHTSDPTVAPSGNQSTSSADPLAPQSFQADHSAESRNECCTEQPEGKVNLGISYSGAFSAGEWADSLTNVSVGDLLSEASKAADCSCINSSFDKGASYPQENPFNPDSLDAVVASHDFCHQLSRISNHASPPSIWNAEETCDEFSFNMTQTLEKKVSNSADYKQSVGLESLGFQGRIKELTQSRPSIDPCDLECPSESTKDPFCNNKYDPTADIYWPDSLGPLDLDIPSSRFQGQDMGFSESISLSGLNRMLASSLDAFQSCSFFGVDRKDLSTGEAKGACPPI